MDWNNDGRLDIIVGDRLGSVNYFRRLVSGNIYLLEESPVEVAGRPIDMGNNSAPCVIDWNNDGLADLVVGRVEAVPAGLYLSINGGSPSILFSLWRIQSCALASPFRFIILILILRI